MRYKLLIVILAFISIGAYARDPAKVREFRQTHACPSTGQFTGACKGYVVDHIMPLCAGGLDEPRNMQWQEYKQSLIKDNLERELCRRVKCQNQH